MKIKFESKLKELREKKLLTQKVLAEALKVNVANIIEWESGKKRPDYELLTEIALFFEVSISFLLGLEDELGNKIDRKAWLADS